MSNTRVLLRTLAAATAAAAIGVPSAAARTTDFHPQPTTHGLESPYQTPQDLRSPDARDAAGGAQAPQDLRSPDARDAASPTPVPGLPVFPAAVTTSVPKPVVHHTSAGNGGVSGATIGFGIAGLVLIAGLVGLGATSRRRARTRVTA
jgi:hypothetical protein